MHSNTNPFDSTTSTVAAERLRELRAMAIKASTRRAPLLDDEERAEATAAVDAAIDSMSVVLEAALAAMADLRRVRTVLELGDLVAEAPAGRS
ncbi:hypothetical protein [Burkholderia gladioli]|uniref:hypothetical protein n=1 Tax=Burkholderia gladioli TaxID=28095 RepID=UPI001640503F|nr:hypothetical protein [Burkholderia gladioli]